MSASLPRLWTPILRKTVLVRVLTVEFETYGSSWICTAIKPRASKQRTCPSRRSSPSGREPSRQFNQTSTQSSAGGAGDAARHPDSGPAQRHGRQRDEGRRLDEEAGNGEEVRRYTDDVEKVRAGPPSCTSRHSMSPRPTHDSHVRELANTSSPLVRLCMCAPSLSQVFRQAHYRAVRAISGCRPPSHRPPSKSLCSKPSHPLAKKSHTWRRKIPYPPRT